MELEQGKITCKMRYGTMHSIVMEEKPAKEKRSKTKKMVFHHCEEEERA